MDVMSLVQDATHIMVFRSKGLAVVEFIDVLPKALEYVKEPEVGVRHGGGERWEMGRTITVCGC